MSGWTRTESPHLLRAIDTLFSQLAHGDPARGHDLYFPEESSPEHPDEPSAASPATPPSPPPKVETQADIQAAYEWLLRERQRLEGFTNAQLGRIQNDHGAMLSRYYLNEQA